MQHKKSKVEEFLMIESILHRLRMFENRMLRRVFGMKRNEVTGDWEKLHGKERHNLNSSFSIIRVIKSMRMRWAGHAA
jgi:hypothetical protein